VSIWYAGVWRPLINIRTSFGGKMESGLRHKIAMKFLLTKT
jgi:hypothetical protein